MSHNTAEPGTLTVETVQHFAGIAQIDLTEEEARTLAEDLSVVLANVSAVSEIHDEQIPQTSRPIPISNMTRPDEVADQLTQEQALQNAPDTQDGMFRVGSILGEGQ